MLSLLRKAKVKYIRSLDKLSIYAFHKIMQTSDYRFLIKEWDEESDVKFYRDEAAKIWAGLYNEYCTLSNNNNVLEYYRVAQRLMYCETRKFVGQTVLSQIAMRKMKSSVFEKYLEKLKSWGFNYISETRNEKAVKDLERQIRACDNEIGLKRDTLDKLRQKGEPMTLEEQTVKVEQALGRNMVDPRETSVLKWHYMMKEINAINDAKRKQMINQKRNLRKRGR